jgi:hypothetical protein
MRLRLHAFQKIDTTDDPAMISEVFGSIGRTKQRGIQIVASPYQPRSDHGLVRPTGVRIQVPNKPRYLATVAGRASELSLTFQTGGSARRLRKSQSDHHCDDDLDGWG